VSAGGASYWCAAVNWCAVQVHENWVQSGTGTAGLPVPYVAGCANATGIMLEPCMFMKHQLLTYGFCIRSVSRKQHDKDLCLCNVCVLDFHTTVCKQSVSVLMHRCSELSLSLITTIKRKVNRK